MRRIRCIVCGVVVFLFYAVSWGQQAATAPSATALSSDDVAALVAREFGPDFVPVSNIPAMIGDFARKGTEDLAIVATCKASPLAMSEKMHYKLEDPYGKYFGFGNPAISTQFSTDEPAKRRHILIVHNWRGTPVGEKFVLVNIPFDRIKLGYMLLRKRTIQVIETEDEIGVQAAIYYDGHRYRWEATSMSEQK
ncbi:MAG TPA: hypothetical protein VMT82_03435 [candidate division Zixibacteria bacterium]|nr:hypothetical protein [candidate division Zixibacteria bacterium]